MWAEANIKGFFKAEIVPVELKSRKGTVIMDTDEHPKPKTTIESLAKLPAVFKKGGVVTAGGASGVHASVSFSNPTKTIFLVLAENKYFRQTR